VTRLFVYGSLKSGFLHHDRMRGAAFVGPAVTRTGYSLVIAGRYPALVPAGDGSVAGEVYEVGAALLEALDRFEGCPELYRRAPIELAGGGEAEAYLMNMDRFAGAIVIPGGVWIEDRRR
jgi:gamma-glutamylcyclotransferase (GGCT)/AIG2-like uncharacterized protein YtfP